ncbi:acyl CoA:acetate/3-ketoacid CoA transferase [Brachybacterium sp.]|uniref:acyl CoA:acetate/3-ketoacid CoA transferase n=1 Tax=Brachybacterium sp. TaxID=1891286 RepID=UPI003F8FC5E3
MKKAHVLTARQAAELVSDGDVVTISSSSALGCPDAVLEGLGRRYGETESPRDLTTLHPIAAGDMWGVKGIDHLAQPGMLRRVIAGSYPSGPSSAEPPAIWQQIEQGEVEAYNFPSGILFQMHRAAASRQPGMYTPVGLNTFADPRQEGGRMNETTPRDIVEVQQVDGQDYLFFRSIAPDVAIIRATTADEFGNLTFEDEGSPLGALDQAYAAHNHGGVVIAQVKRMAEGGSLSPQQVRIPGILVDAIVLAPDQKQTTNTPYDPAISGQLRRPLSELDAVPHSLEKVIARRAARELRNGETVNLGFGVSALVPHVLNEESRSEAVTWVLEQGAVGGVPLLDFAFGCSMNPDAIVQSADQFTLLQGGGFQHALLSFMQIDRNGNVNVHHLPRRRHVTAGVGGFIDITTSAPTIVFMGAFTAGRRSIELTDAGGLEISEDGPHTKLVDEVSSVTFNGRQALERGQKVMYVTERCVLELREEGLVVTELAPGVDLERDVLSRSDFPLHVAEDLKEMDPALFRPELLGITMAVHPDHERVRRLLETATEAPDE